MLPIYLNSSTTPTSQIQRQGQSPLRQDTAVAFPHHVLSADGGFKNHTIPMQLLDNTRTSSSSSKWAGDFRSLPAGFTPGSNDVICGRGSAVWNHPGNSAVRSFVKQSAHFYANAQTRAERSAIVSEIVDCVRAKGTGFVKKDGSNWVLVGDLLAREKVGQMLRNAVSTKYRSSVASKQRRRKDIHIARMEPLHKLMQSDKNVRQSQATMREAAVHGSLSEKELLVLFVQQQGKILEHIKHDGDGLLDRFLLAEVAAVLEMDDSDSDGDVEMKLI